MVSVHNETESFTTRTTREGKNLRYELKVLQQPIRARACGSGSKCTSFSCLKTHDIQTDHVPASADRRPVDPPPIVQLKILEMNSNGAGEETAEDITFMMNANYFLFATLEPARHMAQARGMPDPNKPTVLTGTPVAGMVYLDRPNPAGYFIFPDLSVRHEGYFRLSFSLYEELKRTEDQDKMEDPSRAPSAGDNHVTHRLEVKSAVLQVFSAKKFPGLTESTSLSRVVAEQGCRVRIRRDVRMRRASTRDEKSGKDWDGYEDDTAHQRAKMSRTPEVPPYGHAHYPLGAPPPPPVMEPNLRPRSASNGSHQSFAASLSRRQSQNEVAHQYQQQQQQLQQQQQYGGTAPQTPQSGITPASAYGPSPSQQFSQPPYMQQQSQQQQQPMQPPPTQYQAHAYAPVPAPAPVAPQQSAQYSYKQRTPAYQPQYAPGPPETNSHSQRASVDWTTAPMPTDYHRSSVQNGPSARTQAVPAPPQAAPAPYSTHPYQQAPAPYQTQAPHQPNYHAPIEAQSTRAPPPEPIQPPTRTIAPTPPLSAKPYGSFTLPPISHALEPASPAVLTPSNTNTYFPNSYANQAPGMETHKRTYGSTFSTAHHDMSQKAGARPDSYSHMTGPVYSEYDVDDDEDDEGVLTAGYKRADGQVITRKY